MSKAWEANQTDIKSEVNLHGILPLAISSNRLVIIRSRLPVYRLQISTISTLYFREGCSKGRT